MATLELITDLCRTLAAARRDLDQAVATAQAEIDAVKAGHVKDIAALTSTVAAVADELYAAVAASPDLFKRPKSRTFFDVKVGWGKQPGKVTIANPEGTVALIRKHLPEQFKVLVKTTETPVKKAIAALPGTDIKRIGAVVTDSIDRAFVTPADGDLDKMVAALLGDPATGDDDATSNEEAA